MYSTRVSISSTVFFSLWNFLSIYLFLCIGRKGDPIEINIWKRNSTVKNFPIRTEFRSVFNAFDQSFDQFYCLFLPYIYFYVFFSLWNFSSIYLFLWEIQRKFLKIPLRFVPWKKIYVTTPFQFNQHKNRHLFPPPLFTLNGWNFSSHLKLGNWLV